MGLIVHVNERMWGTGWVPCNVSLLSGFIIMQRRRCQSLILTASPPITSQLRAGTSHCFKAAAPPMLHRGTVSAFSVRWGNGVIIVLKWES